MGVVVLGTVFSRDQGYLGGAPRTVIILDTSLSMLAEDILGSGGLTSSRLDSAKLYIREHLKTDREYALITYARSASLIMPFTRDRTMIEKVLKNIESPHLDWWSDLNTALTLLSLAYREHTPYEVVILTDGGTTSSTPPSLSWHRVITIIGIGSDLWARIPLWYESSGKRRYKTYSGVEVIVTYGRDYLDDIAHELSARILRITSTSDIGQISIESTLSHREKLLIFAGIALIIWFLFHPYVRETRPLAHL
jgi:hypothetical protein